ncbi:hypothetical protein LJK88_16570 [Paenibacillus sp. P26]|nr:hypothetical protein LJK88_16570 [Paenibacillus sp. P26]
MYVATPEAINDPARHAAIVDYLSRLNQFYAWSRDNKEKWAEITASNTKRPVEQALDTLKKSEEQRPTRIIENSPKSIASQQDVADVLNSVGPLKSKVDISQIWSHAFDEELKKIAASP